MAQWGTRMKGVVHSSSEDEPVAKGVIYEVKAVTDVDIDEVVEMPLILAIRDLPNYVEGVQVVYVKAEGNSVIVHWREKGSPLTVGTVALAIVAVAFMIGVPLTVTLMQRVHSPIPSKAPYIALGALTFFSLLVGGWYFLVR